MTMASTGWRFKVELERLISPCLLGKLQGTHERTNIARSEHFLTASLDGTMRIWDMKLGGQAVAESPPL